MKKQNLKRVGFAADPELHSKLCYIAKYEGRSINKQVLYFIRVCVELFERKHGKISVEKEGNIY